MFVPNYDVCACIRPVNGQPGPKPVGVITYKGILLLNYQLAQQDTLCQYGIKNSNKYVGFIVHIHGEVYVPNIINSILSYLFL